MEEEEKTWENDDIYGCLKFGPKQGGATGEVYKNTVQYRVEDITIGTTRDETTENEKTQLTNMLQQAYWLVT